MQSYILTYSDSKLRVRKPLIALGAYQAWAGMGGGGGGERERERERERETERERENLNFCVCGTPPRGLHSACEELIKRNQQSLRRTHVRYRTQGRVARQRPSRLILAKGGKQKGLPVSCSNSAQLH